jgi:hypothetical protein
VGVQALCNQNVLAGSKKDAYEGLQEGSVSHLLAFRLRKRIDRKTVNAEKAPGLGRLGQ